MTADIWEHEERCERCQRVKGAANKIPYQLFPCYKLNDMVSVDIVSPLIPDKYGYKYVISMIDWFFFIIRQLKKKKCPTFFFYHQSIIDGITNGDKQDKHTYSREQFVNLECYNIYFSDSDQTID